MQPRRTQSSCENLEINEIKMIMEELLSPFSVSSLREIDTLLKPLPGYIGPGAWLKLLK